MIVSELVFTVVIWGAIALVAAVFLYEAYIALAGRG